MKTNKLILLLLACAISFSLLQIPVFADVDTSDGTIVNMITNGTFENGILGWTPSSDGIISTRKGLKSAANSGVRAMEFTAAGSAQTRTTTFCRQEAYGLSFFAKNEGAESVTLTLKYNPFNSGERTIATAVLAANSDWESISEKFKWQDSSTIIKNGGAITPTTAYIIIETTGPCLIDEVVLKPEKEKIIDGVGADADAGKWFAYDTITTAYTPTIAAVAGGIEGTNLVTSTDSIMQTFLIEKGATYTVKAKVTNPTESNESARVYFGSVNDTATRVGFSVAAGTTYEYERKFTLNYPTSGDKTTAGGVIAFGSGSASATVDLIVSDVSITKNEAAVAEPEITSITASNIDVGETITPSAVLAAGTTGIRYRYLYNGAIVDFGYADDGTLPSYTPAEAGRLDIYATPVNSEGYGASVTKSVTVTATTPVTHSECAKFTVNTSEYTQDSIITFTRSDSATATMTLDEVFDNTWENYSGNITFGIVITGLSEGVSITSAVLQ